MNAALAHALGPIAAIAAMTVMVYHYLLRDAEPFATHRWEARCNALRLESARLTWLGDRANRPGWVGLATRTAACSTG